MKDLDDTGIFGVFCARHGTLLSLQSMKTGESFKYLDLAIDQLVNKRNYNPKELHLFYDVACRYKQHVLKNKIFDESLRSKMDFIIGQFHVYAHKYDCFKNFNPKYTIGIGTVDGEAAERSWPWYRGISQSVKGMNPYRRKVSPFLLTIIRLPSSICLTIYGTYVMIESLRNGSEG